MLCMYLVRLGVIASLLPDPVIEGFSTASAFVIGISQIKYAMGLFDVPSDQTPIGLLFYCIQRVDEANLACMVITFVALIVLVVIKSLNRRWPKLPFPGPLLVVIVGILVTHFSNIDEAPYFVPVIGSIPSGFPSPMVPQFRFSDPDPNTMLLPDFYEVCREATLLAFLYFIVHVSVARTISFRTGKSVVPNQELLALGITNLGGGWFQTFPNASSISRTSVVTSLGSVVSLHSIVAALVVMIVVQVATSIFAELPFACLAAIVLSGVTGMISFKDLKSLYTHQLSVLKGQAYLQSADTPLVCADFILWCTAFTVTLTVGAMEGILSSLALSVTLIIAGYSRPPTAVLGRLPGCNIFRNVRRFPMAQMYPGITILRFDASLNFSNSDFFRSMLMTQVDRLLVNGVPITTTKLRPDYVAGAVFGVDEIVIRDHQRNFLTDQLRTGLVAKLEVLDDLGENHFIPPLDKSIDDSQWCFPPAVIIDASSMNELDLTAVRMLEKVVPEVESKGVLLLLANWKGPVRDFLDFCDFYRTLPPDRCFLGLYDAIMTALKYQYHLSTMVCGHVIPLAKMLYDNREDSPSVIHRATPLLPHGALEMGTMRGRLSRINQDHFSDNSPGSVRVVTHGECD
eukprot:GHVH01007768.1.p1 GENE.GHVH01007768.1~~GHVH01007768.1.p1  ORF type:complete len:628 (-),score=69.97 GHVH01007768.1:418-2301(-)